MIPDELLKVKEELEAGANHSVSVRQLLQWFSSYRRGSRVVAEVRSALRQLGLVTVPDFDAAWIDGTVRFERRERAEQPSAPMVMTTIAPTIVPPETTGVPNSIPASDVVATPAAPPSEHWRAKIHLIASESLAPPIVLRFLSIRTLQ